MTKQDYHSALWPERNAPACDRWSDSTGVAFVHDIRDPLPPEYERADVLYADLPWIDGVEEFNRRAGITETFGDLVAGVSRIVLNTRIPIILVVGRRRMTSYPEPDEVQPVRLNGAAAVALVYRFSLAAWFGKDTDAATKSTEDLLGFLAGQFVCVGDFCCGYGRSGRIFRQHGRAFVLSDYNPKCIGHIAWEAPRW